MVHIHTILLLGGRSVQWIDGCGLSRTYHIHMHKQVLSGAWMTYMIQRASDIIK